MSFISIISLYPSTLSCNLIPLVQALAPIKYNRPLDKAKSAETLVTLKKSLNIIETYFLKDKKFVAGDQISIADLEFLAEVTQYWIAGCDIYKGRPNMERWMEDCQKALAPHFDSIYDEVYEIRKAGTYHYPIDAGQTM